MAEFDVRISDLPGANPLNGTELVPMVQGGVTGTRSIQNIVSEGGLGQHVAAADPHVQYEIRVTNNLTAVTNPTVNDDSTQGYEVLSRWVNTVTAEFWICVVATVGAANWQQQTLSITELGSAALADVGAGNGLDADLLDGLDSLQFLRSDVSADGSLLTNLVSATTTIGGVVEKATTQESLDATANKFPDATAVHAAFNQYGLGKQIVSAEVDADLYLEAGSYTVPVVGHINFPSGGDNSRATIVITGGSSYFSQIVQQRLAPFRRFVRSSDIPNIATAPWQEIFHSGNVATSAQNLAGTDNDVPTTPAGVHEAFNQYGLGASTGGAVADIDLLDITGFYIVTAATTGTKPGVSGSLFHIERGSSNQADQNFYVLGGAGFEPIVYLRTKNADGLWSSWRTIFHTGNVASSLENLAGTSNTVPATPQGVHEAFGQYGIGAIGVVSDLDINNTRTLNVTFPTSATPNPDGARAGSLIHLSPNATAAQQLVLGENADSVYFRRRRLSTWNAWQEIFHTGNILGTVSQSAGVPTGAIIERGSNANGEYTKFADGTLLMYGYRLQGITAGTGETDVVVTWPTTPSLLNLSTTSPNIAGVSSTATFTIYHLRIKAISGSSATAGISTDTPQDYGVTIKYFGRWF
jgi:hypothetical protein